MPPALQEQIAALSREEKEVLFAALEDELYGGEISDEVKAALDRAEADHAANPQPDWTIEQIRAAVRAEHGY